MLSAQQEKKPFQISDAEINSLQGQMSNEEFSAFKQFANDINNLSPQDQAFLAQLAQDTEQQMKKQGLDPAKFDDVMKFVEQQTAKEAPQEAPLTPPISTEQAKQTQDTIAQPIAEKPLIRPIKMQVSADLTTTLNMLLSNLASLRQKAFTSDYMGHRLERLKQELNELVYFVHVLTKRDLQSYLEGSEYSQLRSTLEKLSTALSTYEPAIIPTTYQTGHEEDPYEILMIPYSAPQEQIKSAYEKLRQEKDPELLSIHLKKEGLSEKAQKKILKEARLAFKFIKRAYETLSDELQKKMIDRLLKEHIDQAAKQEISNKTAFEAIETALSTALYTNDVIGGIKKLLEKYKPEELKIKKAMDDAEKSAFELSKKEKLVTKSTSYGSERGRYGTSYTYDSPYNGSYYPSSYESSYSNNDYDNYPSSRRRSSSGHYEPGSSPQVTKGSQPTTSMPNIKKDKETEAEKEAQAAGLGHKKSADDVMDDLIFDIRSIEKQLKTMQKELTEPADSPFSLRALFTKKIPSYLKKPVVKRIKAAALLTHTPEDTVSEEQPIAETLTADKTEEPVAQELNQPTEGVANKAAEGENEPGQLPEKLTEPEKAPLDESLQELQNIWSKLAFDELVNNLNDTHLSLKNITPAQKKSLKKVWEERIDKSYYHTFMSAINLMRSALDIDFILKKEPGYNIRHFVALDKALKHGLIESGEKVIPLKKISLEENHTQTAPENLGMYAHQALKAQELFEDIRKNLEILGVPQEKKSVPSAVLKQRLRL